MLRAWPVETARPLMPTPPGTCQRCGCALSMYRSPLEQRCAPCQLAEPATVPDDRAATDTLTIVLTVLEAGPLAARDIASRTGICHPTVRDVLRRLREQGRVTTCGPYRRPLYELVVPA